jgi:hypothetical protein
MKTLLRALFLGLALLVLAAQAGRLQAGPPMSDQARLVQGIAALGLRPAAAPPGDGLETALWLAADGCPRPLTLARVQFDGRGTETSRVLLGLHGQPVFVYLGAVGGHYSTLTLLQRWAAASILHVLGLRPPAAPLWFVIVMLPPACPALPRLDWSRLSPWA